MAIAYSNSLAPIRKLFLPATVAGFVLIGIGHTSPSRAQSQTESFEVASVKPSNPAARGVSMNFGAGGSFTGENVSLRTLIGVAYNITCGKDGCAERITGGPNWIDSAGFDLVTKSSAGSPNDNAHIRQRLQTLLAERFKLVIQKETKDMPVYHLVIAKTGHKMKEYNGDAPGGMRGDGVGRLVAQRASLGGLVATLTQAVGRPVINMTGLKERYDFTLEWAAEAGVGAKSPGPGEKPDGPPSDPTAPSIFTALQEQLGLKLEPAKGPVDIIHIVSAEKPSAN